MACLSLQPMEEVILTNHNNGKSVKVNVPADFDVFAYFKNWRSTPPSAGGG